jgi:hypothetical protein
MADNLRLRSDKVYAIRVRSIARAASVPALAGDT